MSISPRGDMSSDWLLKQKPTVVKRLYRLDKNAARLEKFINELSSHCEQVSSSQRLALLYEAWLAVPSEVMFGLACKSKYSQLQQLTDLASRALLKDVDVLSFELDNVSSDPQEELLSWLRDRAVFNKPPQ